MWGGEGCTVKEECRDVRPQGKMEQEEEREWEKEPGE